MTPDRRETLPAGFRCVMSRSGATFEIQTALMAEEQRERNAPRVWKKRRRKRAPGVWYGQLRKAAPATTMKRKRKRPNEVTPRTTSAIVVLISHRYRERAQPSSKSATCNITGSSSITFSKYQLAIPSNLVCRFRQRSMTDPRRSADAYRFNHCLPSIARNAEKSETARLAKRIAWTWIVVRGGPVHCGTTGTPLKVVLSIL